MLDFNMLSGALVGLALVLLMRFVFPLYKDRSSIYKDVKTALLLFGYAFREEKVKAITDMIFSIVTIVENFDKPNIAKQYEAMETAYNDLLKEFNIELEPEVIELLIDIAVAYLPPTKESITE